MSNKIGAPLGPLDFSKKDKNKKFCVIAQGPHLSVLQINELGGGRKTFHLPWTENLEIGKNYFFTEYKNSNTGSLPQLVPVQ